MMSRILLVVLLGLLDHVTSQTIESTVESRDLINLDLVLQGSYLSIERDEGLLKAARNGFVKGIDLLLNFGATIDFMQLPSEKTPLILASEYGHLQAVRILLTNGADINAVDHQGKNAAQHAVDRGHFEVVCALMDQGIDATAVTFGSYIGNCLTYGIIRMAGEQWCENGSTKECTSTCQVGVVPGNSLSCATPPILKICLSEVSKIGLVDGINFFLNSNAAINGAPPNQKTPLILASENGQLAAVKFLLNEGADINAEDILGKNAAQHAVDRGHFEVVCALMDQGINATAVDFGSYLNKCVTSGIIRLAGSQWCENGDTMTCTSTCLAGIVPGNPMSCLVI